MDLSQKSSHTQKTVVSLKKEGKKANNKSMIAMSDVKDETKEEEKEEGENEQEYYNDRVLHQLPAIPRFPLGSKKLFEKENTIHLGLLEEHFKKEGRLEQKAAMRIVQTCAEILKKEPNTLYLNDPIGIVGDVRGQYFDLLKAMETIGDPANTQYLFLGSYVNRGCLSCECVLLLFAYKITFKDSFFMLRGNQDTRAMSTFFSFKDECKRAKKKLCPYIRKYKYNLELYDAIMNCFDCLPIVAILNKRIFCCHGGISPDIYTIEEIDKLNRFQEVPEEGPMCDLLWSDPADEYQIDEDDETKESEEKNVSWFAFNETRQRSYVFGISAIDDFLKRNKLDSIIRGHEANFDGYSMKYINKQTGIPRVLTVHSAPSVSMDIYLCKGACVNINDMVIRILPFLRSPNPYFLPNFMDVFAWSLPFVAEKVVSFWHDVLSFEEPITDTDDIIKSQIQLPILANKRSVLKYKLFFVAQIVSIHHVLSHSKADVACLKSLLSDNKLPPATLFSGFAHIANIMKTRHY
ncbi:hypothetical protein RFI_27003 [Reticulomyxa filosa]|uniref:Serine/threonine specific protein phosphatases domain-containing protein n=1 Tax=Reticulomyxa filosa TaxID=46433 RepID=X6MBI6_RETFI|nr:hypothetical protein RFI_27003 [Reticulomyxa filosa]|eukprot:ETO10375.1 hypothetical protein RFI_27003 [Reticulomyxa filosa]